MIDKNTAAQGQRNLERLNSGKATTNEIRKEYGLKPIKDGDERLIKFDLIRRDDRI